MLDWSAGSRMVRSWCDPEEGKTRRPAWVSEQGRDSADLDFAVGNELIRRHRQIGRRRSLANATRGVVLRAVAGAEEAVVVALMGNRNAAEMGADADHDQPLVMAFLDPGLVGLRIGQARERDAARFIDLLLGAVTDVDRLAAPEHLDVLTFGDRRQVDFDRRAGRDCRGIGIHLGNKRPERSHSGDRGGSTRRNKEEITACRMIRRRRCRHDSKPFLSSSRWNHPGNASTTTGGCRHRDPRGQKDQLSRPIGRNKRSRIVLLAPLPKERKPAIRWPACNALIPPRAMIYSDFSRRTGRAVTRCR